MRDDTIIPIPCITLTAGPINYWSGIRPYMPIPSGYELNRNLSFLKANRYSGIMPYQVTKGIDIDSYGTDYTVRTVLNEVDRTVDVYVNSNYVGQYVQHSRR